MRTKSPGSTKGMGYMTPSKPVGKLMLNFILSPHGSKCRGNRRSIIHATDHDLVEADGAILVELCPYLVGRAAGGVAAHDVVAHEAVDLGPVFRRIGGGEGGLVEPGAGQADVLGMMGAAQHEADRAADRIDAFLLRGAKLGVDDADLAEAG